MTARPRMRLAAAAGGMLLSAAVQAQEASAGDEEFTTLANIASKRAGCNLGTAKRVELKALAAAARRWKGQCIAVEGYWWRGALSASIQDAETESASAPGEPHPRRVGLYGKGRFLRSPPSPQPRIGVGTLVMCEDLWESYSMVFGYCHLVTHGPALALAELRRRKTPRPSRSR